jgi:IS1 family transposase
VRDLACPLVTVDEQWGFVRKKQSRVTERDEVGAGDAWTWVGIDMNSRLVISFMVGKRDQQSADTFMADLRSRLVVMPQITSDGLALYEQPIAKEFGPGVDYAQTIKNYRKGAQRGPDHRYEPPREPFITKRAVLGAPNMAKASTAYVERSNLNVRHMNGRMRRLCLAFSKRLDHHRASMALTYTYANFCRVIRTLRVTAAMQAGVTDHVWTASEFMAVVLAEQLAARPEKKELALRTPEGPARQVSTGAWLRLVTGHPTCSTCGTALRSPIFRSATVHRALRSPIVRSATIPVPLEGRAPTS